MRSSILQLPLLMFVACANADLPPRTLSDPSNSGAAQGVSPLASATGGGQPAATVHGMDMGGMNMGGMDMGGMDMGSSDGGGPTGAMDGAQATKYQCPMHADVIRDAPGRCPKCGMTLVPMAKALPK